MRIVMSDITPTPPVAGRRYEMPVTTFQKHRSNRISACRTLNGQCVLMQWHFDRKGQNSFGAFSLNSFVSIVTRPGKLGLWVDAPYYCYAGEHRYRRLPSGIAARVYIACARGWFHDVQGAATRRAGFVIGRLRFASKYWAPAEILRRRRNRAEWNKFLGIGE